MNIRMRMIPLCHELLMNQKDVRGIRSRWVGWEGNLCFGTVSLCCNNSTLPVVSRRKLFLLYPGRIFHAET
jgi:hypothetical protein